MLTILVTNTKGGCGKTTISTNLAGAFAQAGLRTVLADRDRQQSALAWIDRRPETAPKVRPLDWSKEAKAPSKAPERLVIDAPAGVRRKDLEQLVKAADIVVVPVLPSIFDEATTRRFLDAIAEFKPVRKGKRSVAVVANRVRLRTNSASRLEGFLGAAGHPVIARLRDSQAYVTAAERGLSLFELPPARLRPLLAEWSPLLSFIAEAGAAAEAA